MIHDLKPYPAYKDSGMPWLGRVPEHWEVRRNGRLFTQRNETAFPHLPILEVSLKTGVRIRSFDASSRKQLMSDRDKYKRACRGDIAYNMMRMWQGAVGVPTVDGLVSPAYVVARPLPGTEARYFASLFRTAEYMGEFNNFSRGIVSDRNRLYWNDFKQITSPYPPFAEQHAIVRFLDHANRSIQRYIQAKRRLIALLNEQKQAIIHRAVTRGLDPNVCLKPSGLEWLWDLPEHWEVVPLRRRWTVTDCKHLTVPFVERGVPLASVREAQSFYLSLSNAKQTTREWYETLIEGGRAPRRGDLIYCRNVSVGAAAFVDTDECFAMGQDVCLIRSMDQNQRYLNYFLRSPAINRHLASLLVGSTFGRINITEIKGLLIVVPPRSEQDAIAEHLDGALMSLELGIKNTRREIDRLFEYRARLIADVVTGQLDVREAATRLSDEGEELWPLKGGELGENGNENNDDEFAGASEEAEEAVV